MMISEKPKRFLPAFLCGLVSILFVQATATAGEPVSKEMVLKHFVGQTWIGSTASGFGYESKINRNGTLEVELDNGDSSSGTWKVDNDGYWCAYYDAWAINQCVRFEYSNKLPGMKSYTKTGERSYLEKSKNGDSYFERRVLGKLRSSEKQPVMTEPPKAEKSVQKPRDTDRPAESGSENSITDRLKALKKLKDAGLISKEEAAAKRKELLKNL
jgi:hypothetical protein